MKNLRILLLFLGTSLFAFQSSAQTCAEAIITSIGGLSMEFIDTANVSAIGCGFTPVAIHTTWDFGDNSSLDTGKTVYHTYSSSGTYNVTMTVYNATLTQSVDSIHVVTVSAGPQSSCANFSKSSVNNLAYFTNTSSCAGQNTYIWNFGDGFSSSAYSPNHIYSSGGTYLVTLSVFANSTFIDTVSSFITVSNAPVPCASFADTVNGNVGKFYNTSSCVSPVYYNWSFGDGTFGSGAVAWHTYSSAGYKKVKLKVLDSSYYVLDSAEKLILIGSPPPPPCNALFTKSQALDSNNNNIPIPGAIVITNQSIGQNLTYYWDFGDGTNSTANRPVHTYSGNGPYVLCLTISGTNCTSTFCDTLSVDTNGIVQKRAPGFSIYVGWYTGPTGINEVESSSLKLYPNPASDILSIDLNEFDNVDVVIRIIDMKGQVVLRKSSITKKQIEQIDVSGLGNGIYMLNINTNGDSINERLIIE